jgi:phosphotransferase system HPr (HPr) family protein
MAESIHGKQKIKNRCGFHVRPIQRFTQLAKAFESDVDVTINGKTAPGKSIMHLMGLKGECGADFEFDVAGPDSRQAFAVLDYLVDNSFFVEDELDKAGHPERHLERLARFAAAFDSDVRVRFNGDEADAKDLEAVRALGFRFWDQPEIHVDGPDADQARNVFQTLVQYRFFVEEEVPEQEAAAG